MGRVAELGSLAVDMNPARGESLRLTERGRLLFRAFTVGYLCLAISVILLAAVLVGRVCWYYEVPQRMGRFWLLAVVLMPVAFAVPLAIATMSIVAPWFRRFLQSRGYVDHG